MAGKSWDSVSQADPAAQAVEPGTLMQKPIPPRMIEPYLTGRRAVISGFAYRVADSPSAQPRDLYRLFSLDYPGSEFRPDADEIYVLRWRVVRSEAYQLHSPAERGAGWAARLPFRGAGSDRAPDHGVPEFFTDAMPVPVGAEIHRICADMTDFIARYDGQVWLRPAEGPELCATG
jgi:hypothetical protein